MADVDRQVKKNQWKFSVTFSFYVIRINIADKVKALMWSDRLYCQLQKKKKLHLRLNHFEYRYLRHTTGMISHTGLNTQTVAWRNIMQFTARGVQIAPKVLFDVDIWKDIKYFFYISLTVHLVTILANEQLDTLFRVFIYFISLDVSSVTMLIIRR